MRSQSPDSNRRTSQVTYERLSLPHKQQNTSNSSSLEKTYRNEGQSTRGGSKDIGKIPPFRSFKERLSIIMTG